MTPDAMRHAARTATEPPPGLPGPLRALWWDAHGDWDRAHAAAQDGKDTDSAWVHAYLHRKEGDLMNADYWYGRARCSRPTTTLEAEWEAIAGTLLGRLSPRAGG